MVDDVSVVICILSHISTIRSFMERYLDIMLENLRIGRVAVHEVHRRGVDRRIVPPDYAQQLENLTDEALDAFRLRVTDAMSAQAKCVEMNILKTGDDSFLGVANSLMGASDAEFLQKSAAFADNLSSAQTTQTIPGGMVIVFGGTTGPLSSPFVGVIKAEVQDGFRRRKNGGTITTEFVNDLFLTKATRLYKIGLMIRVDDSVAAPAGWSALVFDHHIVASNREAAALYFYESFVGCGFLENSAYETAKFFNLTREFVNKQIADRDQRHDINDALYTFVKTDTSQTFTVDEFASRYVPDELKDRYEGFMESRQFPQRAVQRDISELRSRLKRRRFKYGTDIEFSASPEAIAEGRAKIKTVQNPGAAEEDSAFVTVITIQSPFTGEK